MIGGSDVGETSGRVKSVVQLCLHRPRFLASPFISIYTLPFTLSLVLFMVIKIVATWNWEIMLLYI